MGDSFGAAIVYYRSLKELGLLATEEVDVNAEKNMSTRNSMTVSVEGTK